MTNPTESLVARLRRRADTMNGTQPVGASDGCGTMTLGYYSGGDRDLDREAAERLSTLEAALRPFAEFVPDFFDDGYQDGDIVKVESHHGGLDLTLTVADFRRARNIIGEA